MVGSILSLVGNERVVDRVEDGGRAKVIEEAVSALVFSEAEKAELYGTGAEISSTLLKTIKAMTRWYEVGAATEKSWDDAIKAGYRVFRKIRLLGAGVVTGNMFTKELGLKSLEGDPVDLDV